MFQIDKDTAIGSNGSQEPKSSKGESFLKGTFILTVAGLVVKVIGSLNWIFVSRILGGEGIGLYQMAFPIYFLAMTVSQAGVPVAISIITAERVALKDIYGARRVFHISMALMVVTGIFFSILTYFAADWLIEWHFLRDPRAYKSVVVLAPTVFFVTLLASSRGYLQGWQRMTPTAVSQIVEQIFRVITMVLLADLFLPWGLDYAAAGASLGALAGAITGLIVLVYFHVKLDRDIERDYGHDLRPPEGTQPEPARRIIKRIFQLSLPVSAASIMLPVVSNLDLMIVRERGDGAVRLSDRYGGAARQSLLHHHSLDGYEHRASDIGGAGAAGQGTRIRSDCGFGAHIEYGMLPGFRHRIRTGDADIIAHI